MTLYILQDKLFRINITLSILLHYIKSVSKHREPT